MERLNFVQFSGAPSDLLIDCFLPDRVHFIVLIVTVPHVAEKECPKRKAADDRKRRKRSESVVKHIPSETDHESSLDAEGGVEGPGVEVECLEGRPCEALQDPADPRIGLQEHTDDQREHDEHEVVLYMTHLLRSMVCNIVGLEVRRFRPREEDDT